MKKKEKGQPGYIKWRKEKYLIGTIAEFAVVIALVVLGYVQTKTKLNLLTVVASAAGSDSGTPGRFSD